MYPMHFKLKERRVSYLLINLLMHCQILLQLSKCNQLTSLDINEILVLDTSSYSDKPTSFKQIGVGLQYLHYALAIAQPVLPVGSLIVVCLIVTQEGYLWMQKVKVPLNIRVRSSNSTKWAGIDAEPQANTCNVDQRIRKI